TLLTTSPAEHQANPNMRIVDPSLGVFVNNNTDSKIGLFRRVFEALDLDTEELVFTLRPPSTDPEKDFPAESVVQLETNNSAHSTENPGCRTSMARRLHSSLLRPQSLR